jgi:hypothetical protein
MPGSSKPSRMPSRANRSPGGNGRCSSQCPVPPLPESELLHKLQAFAGAQDAVDELRRRGLLAKGADGVLTLTDAGQVTHGRAAAGVATVRNAVRAALPEDNYATLLRPLADLIDGLDRTA